MKKLEIYTDGFNAQKATIHLLHKAADFTITQRVYQQTSADELITPQATFSYVRRGSKLLFVDGEEFVLSAGDLLYIPKNAAVFSYLESTETVFESINVTVSAAGLDGFKHCLNHTRFICDHAVKSLFEKLVALDQDSKFPPDFLADLFKLIHVEKSIVTKDTRTSDSEKPTDTLRATIATAVYNQLTLPEIANHCNMSLSTFKRHFEQQFGLAPKDWIIRRKLETAYFEMLVLKKSVSDACYASGFENLPHFSYSFKKHFGFAPSHLANRNSKLN